MLNAAAELNRKRQDARIKERREDGTSTVEDMVSEMPIIGGKRLDDLTSDEYLNYLGGPRPRVINVTKPAAEE
jgi:hypothetical protein